MSYIIALDLKGHLVELRHDFATLEEVIQYLHKHYKSFNELELYIIYYTNGLEYDPTYGTPYKYNMDTYYVCEDGVYYEEHYHEIDQGQGVKEIGSTYLVNTDLLPQDLKDDGELVEIAIEKWFNSMDSKNNKPNWLI